MYNLQADLEEKNNPAAKFPDWLRNLSTKLTAWEADVDKKVVQKTY